MKSFKLFFAFLFGSLIILTSCQPKNEILGEWQLSGMNIEKAIANIPDDQKDMARKLMTSLFKRMKGKMKAIFEEDGDLRLENPTESGKINIENGTWHLSADKKKLTTVIDGKTDKLNIIQLNQEQMVIGMVLSGQGEVDLTFRHN